MKKLLAFSIATLFVSSIFAEDAANPAQFEEHKKNVLAEMEKGSALHQTVKSCIQAATNQEGIKKCRETAKADREKLQTERKQMRAQKLDERIKKLQDEKAKMATPEKK